MLTTSYKNCCNRSRASQTDGYNTQATRGALYASREKLHRVCSHFGFDKSRTRGPDGQFRRGAPVHPATSYGVSRTPRSTFWWRHANFIQACPHFQILQLADNSTRRLTGWQRVLRSLPSSCTSSWKTSRRESYNKQPVSRCAGFVMLMAILSFGHACRRSWRGSWTIWMAFTGI